MDRTNNPVRTLLILFAFVCSIYTQGWSQIDSSLIESSSQKINIAFGSCNKSSLDQPLWKEMLKNNTQLFIWTGDNIYGDSENPQTLAEKYQRQKNNTSYGEFTDKVNIIGTWDDHDYGKNDAGKEFSIKKESRDLALSFLDVPKSNPVWEREGIYQSYLLMNGRLRIILLDTRYFRDLPVKNEKIYSPNFDGYILGIDQWVWLENELQIDDVELTVIVSSIQLIPEQQPYEKWANFPNARKRILALVDSSNCPNFIILSGDRHMAEMSKITLSNKEVLEVTSSGLTHVWEDMPEEANKYRQHGPVKKLNFGLLKINLEKQTVDVEVKGKNNELFFEHKTLILD